MPNITPSILERPGTMAIHALRVLNPRRAPAIIQIRAHQQINRNSQVPHQTVADNLHTAEARQDFTHFIGAEPAHVAGAGGVGGVEADAAAGGHGGEEGGAGVAEGLEGLVQIESAEAAGVGFAEVGEAVGGVVDLRG